MLRVKYTVAIILFLCLDCNKFFPRCVAAKYGDSTPRNMKIIRKQKNDCDICPTMHGWFFDGYTKMRFIQFFYAVFVGTRFCVYSDDVPHKRSISNARQIKIPENIRGFLLRLTLTIRFRVVTAGAFGDAVIPSADMLFIVLRGFLAAHVAFVSLGILAARFAFFFVHIKNCFSSFYENCSTPYHYIRYKKIKKR